MQSQNGAAHTCGIPSSATFVAKGNYGTADAMIGLDAKMHLHGAANTTMCARLCCGITPAPIDLVPR